MAGRDGTFSITGRSGVTAGDTGSKRGAWPTPLGQWDSSSLPHVYSGSASIREEDTLTSQPRVDHKAEAMETVARVFGCGQHEAVGDTRLGAGLPSGGSQLDVCGFFLGSYVFLRQLNEGPNGEVQVGFILIVQEELGVMP